MMAEEEISKEKVDQLVEDALYLQDEAEAMQYVIDDVPYAQSPPEGKSIAEMLLLVDHAQNSYYRPILEKAINNPRPTHLEKFTYFVETFETDEEKVNDIHKTLRKLAKHRVGLVNVIKNISLIDWETIIYKEDQQLLLYNFMREMITFERGILKDIASQVMVFNHQKESNRKIKQRRSLREDKNSAKN